MVIKNICVKKTYEKDGQQKTQWLQVGKLKELDGGRQFIELSMFPQTSFYVFDEKKKDNEVKPQTPEDIDWQE